VFPPERLNRGGASGFTLVEALIAIAILGLASTVLLVGSSSSLQTTDESLKRTIAAGMAAQLMDEVLGATYCADRYSGHQYNLGRSWWESQGSGRERYGDIDDYDNVRTSPPTDPYGVPLGKDDGRGGERHPAFWCTPGFIHHWRQEIDVFYVTEDDPATPLPAGVATDYRLIEVRIIEQPPGKPARELARLRRVVAYVPPL